MQSRDVDLVFHDRETLQEFDRRLASWNLQWREHGRNRFNDCHLRDDPRKSTVVDAWKASGFEEAVFRGVRGRRGVAIKAVPGRSLLPGLPWLLQDKVETVPRRVRDRVDKQTKDLRLGVPQPRPRGPARAGGAVASPGEAGGRGARGRGPAAPAPER